MQNLCTDMPFLFYKKKQHIGIEVFYKKKRRLAIYF